MAVGVHEPNHKTISRIMRKRSCKLGSDSKGQGPRTGSIHHTAAHGGRAFSQKQCVIHKNPHNMSKPTTMISMDPTAAFFADLAKLGHEPLLEDIKGSIHVDVRRGARREGWTLVIDHGAVKVSREREADCYVA